MQITNTPPDYGLLCEIRLKSGLSIPQDVLRYLHIAARVGSFQIIENQFGRPIGYVVWGFIVSDSIRMMAESDFFPKYDYEFMEGHIPFILDVVAMPFQGRKVLEELKIWTEKKRIFGFRKNGRIVMCKRKAGSHRRIINKVSSNYSSESILNKK